MKTITPKELKTVLDKHAKWLRDEEGGERADLSDTDLSHQNLNNASLDGASLNGASLDGASLSYASLNNASLDGASLNGASLNNASLNNASLSYASLNGASLNGASLNNASLNNASLSYASLNNASLNNASLNHASLDGASLSYASLNGALLNYWIIPEEGAFVAWKSVRSLVDKRPIVLKLQIADGTERACCYSSRKCRVATCTPIAAYEKNGEPCEERVFCADYDSDFRYVLNEEARAPEFDADPTVECGKGLHIWVTRKEAEEWL